MKAYLEVNNGMWFDDYVYSAVEPLNRLGIEIIKAEELHNYNFHKKSPTVDDIFIGSVDGTIAFWKELGIEPPSYLGYSNDLKQYLHRNISTMLFGDLKPTDLPVFIKPKNNVKEFTGFVLEKDSTLANISMYYSQIKPETEVYVSETIDIVSEYRVFVHKNEIVGIKHYAGDFNLFPNINEVKKMKDDYKTDLISYTLDVGIMSKTQLEIVDIHFAPQLVTKYTTVLIEVNDFWAIGGYGLDGKIYTRMIIDRFQQIKKDAEKHIMIIE